MASESWRETATLLVGLASPVSGSEFWVTVSPELPGFEESGDKPGGTCNSGWNNRELQGRARQGRGIPRREPWEPRLNTGNLPRARARDRVLNREMGKTGGGVDRNSGLLTDLSLRRILPRGIPDPRTFEKSWRGVTGEFASEKLSFETVYKIVSALSWRITKFL